MTPDQTYLNILLERIAVCKTYQPKFGQGGAGLSLAQFEQLYGADAFYAWFGLDSPLMYAAHRAAGGITSVYRQIGIGCEALFRQVVQDQLGLEPSDVVWSYHVESGAGSARQLALDAQIPTQRIADAAQRERFGQWLDEAAQALSIATEVRQILKGAVFEVRQGYKSKDSKRQNADITNAAHTYAQGYLPIIAVLSTQIDTEVALLYQNARWLLLRGYTSGTSLQSIYTFTTEVLDYDLAAFFVRNAPVLKAAILDVLQTLLEAHD